MSKKKETPNPFYVLLVVAGVAFSVTACAYCVMAFRAIHDKPVPGAATADFGLLSFLDEHGAALMGIELLVLAACTAGAILLDRRPAAGPPGSATTPEQVTSRETQVEHIS